jgi:hypothetical protein
VELARSQDASCTDPAARREWLQAVQHVSDDTAAYLNPDELEPLWSRIDAGSCQRGASGSDRAWLDLWAALARRDTAAIVASGTSLIAPETAVAPADRAYITTAIAAAEVNMGQEARARVLLQSEWNRLDHTGPFDFPLRELRAMTQGAAR